jgi:hypothetical protein
MRITNTQKKELADIFRSYELNLLDFEVSGEYQEFKIKFKYDYFSFSIERKTYNEFLLMIFPIDNTKGITHTGNWESAKSRFKTWAEQLAKEFNTPTGWETFESENFLDTSFDELEEEFSASEKLQIRQSIKELEERIKTLELPSASLQIIEKKLNELSNKVDELNKFDWKALFIGTIANLILTSVIPKEFGGMIWEYIKIAFRIKLHM